MGTDSVRPVLNPCFLLGKLFWLLFTEGFQPVDRKCIRPEKNLKGVDLNQKKKLKKGVVNPFLILTFQIEFFSTSLIFMPLSQFSRYKNLSQVREFFP